MIGLSVAEDERESNIIWNRVEEEKSWNSNPIPRYCCVMRVLRGQSEGAVLSFMRAKREEECLMHQCLLECLFKVSSRDWAK